MVLTSSFSISISLLFLLLYTSDLLARIGEATKPDGTVEQIGHILVNWVCHQVIIGNRPCCSLDITPLDSKNCGTPNSSKVVMIRAYNLVKNTELDCVTDLLVNNVLD